MKQFFLAVSVSVMVTTAMHAQVKPKSTVVKPKSPTTKPVAGSLKNSIDSFSYALGMSLASFYKQPHG